ncbi:glycosyl transferase group 1 [Rivularia sp. PCC 7116]|uniref:glycosyltransferase n=1 Tax=Rivularia sp. PCC 7116 TaxID=373994 RepID=UPI00029F2579|nr:glycosyltransferase [Rivularia sp. PCC 7116]AFY58274.1 glycosyl transferase group 1 [Rivularia sp. PCC 7116]
MKINWFSPLPPAKTGIAEYTKCLLPALSSHAEVFLWTDRKQWDSDLEQYAKVRHYDLADIPWFEINQADLNIYHIGNNRDFHYAIWQISAQCPGLVVLHDLRLQDFFAGIYHRQKLGRDTYISHMKRYYGKEGEQVAQSFWNGTLTTEYIAELYPLTPLALENAVATVVHTKEAFNNLKDNNNLLVGYAPLPYFDNQQVAINNRLADKPFRLIILGYIGPNRCLEAVLKALSSLEQKDLFRLDIYGQVWDKDYICHQIQQLGLTKLVKIHGFVEDEELDSALANAHLAINLRYPTMGEASLSQLRIWSHALPSLVTQIGWYAEQTETTVLFVRPKQEIEDICHHLTNLIDNPEFFAQIGRNGQKILRERHNPEIYAQAIANFAYKAKKYQSSSVAYKLAEKISRDLSHWMSYELSNDQIQRTAEAIHFITNSQL